jgi:hypothetical protein
MRLEKIPNVISLADIVKISSAAFLTTTRKKKKILRKIKQQKNSPLKFETNFSQSSLIAFDSDVTMKLFDSVDNFLRINRREVQ